MKTLEMVYTKPKKKSNWRPKPTAIKPSKSYCDKCHMGIGSGQTMFMKGGNPNHLDCLLDDLIKDLHKEGITTIIKREFFFSLTTTVFNLFELPSEEAYLNYKRIKKIIKNHLAVDLVDLCKFYHASNAKNRSFNIFNK